MTYERKEIFPHRVEMENRSHLTVNGVEDVERFDEAEIVMRTVQGTLIVSGSDLHIGKLSLDGGELLVEGQIDSLLYEQRDAQRGGLLSRLFG